MSIIFFIFGITLDTSELLTAVKAWKALAFGLASMLFLTPLFGFIAVRLPFDPREFAIGLAIMACVPSSLSSGVTLVIQGYGNGALALLFTVAGNVTGIVTAPLMVKAVLGSAINAKINSVDLLVKLGVSILMPLLVGKAMREAIPPVRCGAARVWYWGAWGRCWGALRQGGVPLRRRASGRPCVAQSRRWAGPARILQAPIIRHPLTAPGAPRRKHICKFKAPLYLINNLQITLIVWQKVSAAREVLIHQEAIDVLMAALAAVLLHFSFLMFHVVVTWLARFPEGERRCRQGQGLGGGCMGLCRAALRLHPLWLLRVAWSPEVMPRLQHPHHSVCLPPPSTLALCLTRALTLTRSVGIGPGLSSSWRARRTCPPLR